MLQSLGWLPALFVIYLSGFCHLPLSCLFVVQFAIFAIPDLVVVNIVICLSLFLSFWWGGEGVRLGTKPKFAHFPRHRQCLVMFVSFFVTLVGRGGGRGTKPKFTHCSRHCHLFIIFVGRGGRAKDRKDLKMITGKTTKSQINDKQIV